MRNCLTIVFPLSAYSLAIRDGVGFEDSVNTFEVLLHAALRSEDLGGGSFEAQRMSSSV